MLEASITKKLDKDGITQWLNFLPQKFSEKYIRQLYAIAQDGKYLLWMKDKGIKLLK